MPGNLSFCPCARNPLATGVTLPNHLWPIDVICYSALDGQAGNLPLELPNFVQFRWRVVFRSSS
jgi:hypothetical protein